MDLSEKIIDKTEELLDEFEDLSLEQVAKKIKQIEKRDNDLIFKIAYLAARISILNKRIQKLIDENSANDNLILENSNESSNIVEKIIKQSKKPKDIPVEWVRVQIIILIYFSELTKYNIDFYLDLKMITTKIMLFIFTNSNKTGLKYSK